MRLSAKIEEKQPKYYKIRENNNAEEVILYNIDDYIDGNEDDISSVYYDINKDRTNKLYEWQSEEEIVNIITKEPLTIEQIEMIEEQLKNTDLHRALNTYRIEYVLYDIRKIKEQIKELKSELLKLNEMCCAMMEAVYND